MKNIASATLGLFAVISLTGCATNAQGIPQQQVRVNVVEAERTQVVRGWSINSDCSFESMPRLRVIEAPKHGSIEIVTENIYPNDQKYPHCRVKKVRGAVGYYKPAAGFVGKDHLIVRQSFQDGNDLGDANITVNVVK